MNNETFTVKKDFIIRAHTAACPDWKAILEKEFPTLFHKGFIGKKGYPVDNSYCVHAVTGEPPSGVGPAGNWNKEASLVTVISEPYKMMVNGSEKEFITVLFNSQPYRILNNIEDSPRPVRGVSSVGHRYRSSISFYR